jgi:TRAP transporter TAXI family solute receptor
MSIIVLLVVTNTALAVTITTGSKKGNYFKVGYNLSHAIGGKNTVIPSKGSIENLDRLIKGTAQVGIVQMDAYAYYIEKHPEAINDIEIIGNLYKECAYLAVRCKGKVKNEDNLQTVKNIKIAVGKKGSGTAVSWNYMLQLEPKYKNAQVMFTGGVRSLGKLASKQLDAVMWVTAPKINGKMASTVMKNKELCLVGFNDMDLNDKLESTGKPVYNFNTIDISKGLFNDKEIKTICVDAVIVARSDVDEDILETISDIVLNYKSTLIGDK